jgi:serine/threonine protein kinase
MEKLTSVTLEDFIATYGRMGVTEALEIFQQIVAAVAYMHDKNLSPRDIKPENIAYDFEANHAKIFDLGLALRLPVNSDGSSPLTSVTTGSPLYMAPEVIGNKPHDTFAHDIWCLGQVLYYMVVGQSPFQWCHTLAELRDELLVFRKIKYPSWLDFNTTLLLKGMLDFDPTLRLEIGQVIESVEELLVATRR